MPDPFASRSSKYLFDADGEEMKTSDVG